jgi:hypothetical protein
VGTGCVGSTELKETGKVVISNAYVDLEVPAKL